jgi:hypothetical protein
MFGPIFLIGVGIVLLLVSSGRLAGKQVAILFADYWPVLLIIWGAIKLVEYSQAKREGVPAPGIGGGGVVLLVFLILFGLAATGARKASKNVDWTNFGNHVQFGDEDFGDMFGGNKYTFDDTIEKDFPANANLKAVTERGDVTVIGSTDNKIHIIVHKTVYEDNEQEAKKTSDATVPAITTVDNLVTIDASHRNGTKGARIDLQISLPRKAAIDLMTMKGALNVVGRDGEVKMHNSNGDVTAEDVAGNVDAHMRGGNLNVRRVKGDVTLEGRGNDVIANEISGKLSLQGEYDSIQLGKVDKGVHFNSTRTDMEFVKLDGELVMSNGELRANSLTGPFRVSTRSKDIELEDVAGDVKVENTNGHVQITPKNPVANIDVTNKNGEVTLMLPGDGNFTVDALSTRGDIETDFNLNNAQNSSREAHSTGTVGKGGPRVQVRDEHATIHINKR